MRWKGVRLRGVIEVAALADCIEDGGQILIGGPADWPVESVHAQDAERRVMASVLQSTDVAVPWSVDGLKDAQRRDKCVGLICQLMQDNTEQPPWDSVVLKSPEVRTLWGMWPRLSIADGLLERRFESADGSGSTWQVVLPAELRHKFMEVAHGGMTGGHLD